MHLLLVLTALADDPPPWLAERADFQVHLVAGSEVAEVTATYQMVPVRKGWLDVVLLGPQLVVSRVDGPLGARPGGLGLVLPPDTAPRTVTVHGTVAIGNGEFYLPIFPAGVEAVQVDAPGLDAEVVGAVDGVLGGSSGLLIHFTPQRTEERHSPPPLVRAQVGTAFWEEEGSLKVTSHLKFAVLRGEQQEFRMELGGLGEVEVEGPGLAHWEMQGSTLVVEARSPVRDGLELTIHGRAPLPQSSFSVPAPVPIGVQRSERWYTLGRSSEVELAPAGGRTVSGRQVPSWVTSLSETTPLVWWQGETPQLTPLRYESEMGPDTVVERAELLVVANDSGSVLLRSTWYVRNERRQYLHFRPSAGFVPVAARRGSEPVKVLSDGDGGLYVALDRSVETVRGLLAMPVEVTWIGRGEEWKKRGSYRLELPSVDAPVQAVAWEVHLPRGYKPVQHRGAMEDYAPVFDASKEQAQDAVYNAVESYRKNDFDQAQVWLEHARELGPTDENAERLQSNLDLLLGNTVTSSNSGGDDAAARRVRDLANARTGELRAAQEEAEKDAKEALAAGDLDTAEVKLEEVTRSAELLQRMEQSGSEDQRDRYSSSSSALAEVREKKKASSAGKKAPDSGRVVVTDNQIVLTPSATEGWDSDGDGLKDDSGAADAIDFEGLDIQGEISPDDAAFAPVETEPTSDTVVSQDEVTVTGDFLQQIPTGRSYQTVVQSVPGVVGGPFRRGGRANAPAQPVAADPVPTAPPPVSTPTPVVVSAPPRGQPAPPMEMPPETSDEPAAGLSGMVLDGQISNLGGLGTRGTGMGGGGASVGHLGTKAEDKRPSYKVDNDAEYEEDLRPEPPPPPPPPPKPARAAPEKARRDTVTRNPTPEARGPAPATPSVDPNRRLDFAQRPTPMTLALPLGGEAIYRSQALLEPGINPVLTIVYRRGEP